MRLLLLRVPILVLAVTVISICLSSGGSYSLSLCLSHFVITEASAATARAASTVAAPRVY